ncbi:hypothetical protein PHLCEN_2v4175 [Hermanssonia centrifuga]|uniref:Uncharacterized protein n=1 Tax=Hermanssonia centrifuga TaxID=98765 RepID=A0A2R6PZ43_9APHY|nr:hypothetical protein PHLCEN_2v4175 [Hermanssonia centrifuga]
MIALQKPAAFFSQPQAYFHRPSHSRNPSAPVVIRPTHTPGLLSLSKPAQQPSPRPQQVQQYARAPRSAPKGKQQRSPQPASAQPQPVEDSKKPSPYMVQADLALEKAAKSVTAVPASDRSARGRQSTKPAAKDKADRRYDLPVD